MRIRLNQDGTCPVFPRLLYIEPTNHCTAKCYMCPSRVGVREKGFMDLELYKKIIDDVYPYINDSRFRSEFVIYLIGQGDSFMSKDLFRMIDYAKKKNLKTGLITTGLLLNKRNAENIIKSGIDVVEFSLYALDREKYANIHGVDKLELAFKNVIAFLHLSKNSKTEIIANVLHTNRNISEIGFLNYMYRSLPFSRQCSFYVKNFHGLFDQLGLTEDIEFVQALSGPPAVNCPTNVMLVYWDGDVNPCPSDYEKRFIVGNAGHDDVFKIWNNERYKTFRRATMKQDYRDLGFDFCNKCSSRHTPGLKGRVGDRSDYRFIMNHFPLGEEDNWMRKLGELRAAAGKG